MPCPGPPSMKTPADTGGGGGSTCGGDLLPRETRRRNFGGGAEGLWRSPSEPQFRGTPKHARPVASHGASGGVLHGTPDCWFGAASLGPLPAWTPKAGFSPTPRIKGVAGSHPTVMSRCTLGAGTCAGRGGGCPRGPLSPVPCRAVRPVTFTAVPALHRLEGGPETAFGRRARVRTRDSGSGLRCPSPARLRRLLAPPPAPSRKVPKRSPNVRKRNFLFPTLERAALRWPRGELGAFFPPGRGRGLSGVGEVGWPRRLPPRPPLPHPALLFQPAVFSLRPPLLRQLAPP